MLLAFGMLVTGSINTIATKIADWQSAYGADENKPCPVWSSSSKTESEPAAPCQFIHPFFQALCMFLGEFSCLGVFYAQRAWQRCRGRPNGPALPLRQAYIFLLPACCDMAATSTMYIGLLLTYASFFQMLRGSVVIFTAIFSRIFLKRMLKGYHLLGIALVLAGTLVVGADSLLHPSSGAAASNPLLGNALIVGAQVIVAVQMCVEEVFVGGKDVPALQAVGLEGAFGTAVLSLALIAMYHLPGVASFSETPRRFEDALDALLQIFRGGNLALMLSSTPLPAPRTGPPPGHLRSSAAPRVHEPPPPHTPTPAPACLPPKRGPAPPAATHRDRRGPLPMLTAVLAMLCSIAFFNFFGISVTKHTSAAHRMVLDSLRVMVVWGFGLAVHALV